jgi:hypothetical protein
MIGQRTSIQPFIHELLKRTGKIIEIREKIRMNGAKNEGRYYR